MKNPYEFSNLDNFEDMKFLYLKDEYEYHKIRNKETNSIYCALIHINNFEDIGRNQFINLYRQLTIFPNLNHPSINKFYGYSPVDFTNEKRPVIITDLCPTFSLNSIFTADYTTKLKIIYGISAGMSYLHSHNIIHRDLKPSTIFLDDRLFPKISCFDLCKSINPNIQEKSEFIKGTLAYLAPEVFTKQEYSQKSDVYSFSLIFYQIMTNCELFQGLTKNPNHLRQFVISGGRPNKFGNIPQCFRNLIEKCWSEEPNERPSFDSILDRLKNDRSFITDEVSEEEFHEYIKYIEGAQISFDPNRRIQKIESDQESDEIDFNSRSNHFNFRVQTVFDTEFDSISLYLYYFKLNNFVKNRKIGRGRYSDVYEIFYQDPITKYRYPPLAAKIFKSKMSDIYDLYSQEVIINSHNYHPCINRLIGYSPIDFEGKKYPIIIFECYSNSSLDKLFALRNKLNETTKLIIMYGIAAGMSYLHSNNIIHRDLNPTNIFLDFYFFPKIGDFGTADYKFEKEGENEEEEEDYYESFL